MGGEGQLAFCITATVAAPLGPESFISSSCHGASVRRSTHPFGKMCSTIDSISSSHTPFVNPIIKETANYSNLGVYLPETWRSEKGPVCKPAACQCLLGVDVNYWWHAIAPTNIICLRRLRIAWLWSRLALLSIHYSLVLWCTGQKWWHVRLAWF